jgi:hypothetical protein
LGILAGGGPLPRRIADTRRASGGEVFIIAFEGQTAPETVEGLDHVWHRLGATSTSIKALQAAGCREVVMAGPMKRPALSELSLDARSALAIARAGSKVFGDDGLLSVIVGELEREGFRVIGIEDVLGGYLAPTGCIAGRDALSEGELADIRRGVEVLRAVGRADVGQAVAVQEGLILAVEAVEGTDAMIARAGELKRTGDGPILIKGMKPGQDGRADRPTIGAATMQAAADAGFAGAVIEAHASLVVDKAATVRAAEDAGLFLHALVFEDLS